jgi:hypothetical protein
MIIDALAALDRIESRIAHGYTLAYQEFTEGIGAEAIRASYLSAVADLITIRLAMMRQEEDDATAGPEESLARRWS